MKSKCINKIESKRPTKRIIKCNYRLDTNRPTSFDDN